MELWLWLFSSPLVLGNLSWGLIELLHVFFKDVVSVFHEFVNDQAGDKDESQSVEVLFENQVGKAAV